MKNQIKQSDVNTTEKLGLIGCGRKRWLNLATQRGNPLHSMSSSKAAALGLAPILLCIRCWRENCLTIAPLCARDAQITDLRLQAISDDIQVTCVQLEEAGSRVSN